jgi:phage/plasmid-associated DNA primase
MEIKSHDHGTWRRIRVVEFMSLFVENPVQGDCEKPYQYKLVKNIEDMFDRWKEVFLAMLVERAFQTEGNVRDCDIVLKASQAYKEREDCFAEFIRDRIIAATVEMGGGNITKSEVNHEFDRWYTDSYGSSSKPACKELHEYLDRQLCKYSKEAKAWVGYRLQYEARGTSSLGSGASDGGGSEEYVVE